MGSAIGGCGAVPSLLELYKGRPEDFEELYNLRSAASERSNREEWVHLAEAVHLSRRA